MFMVFGEYKACERTLILTFDIKKTLENITHILLLLETNARKFHALQLHSSILES
jgi:hypothetical protein